MKIRKLNENNEHNFQIGQPVLVKPPYFPNGIGKIVDLGTLPGNVGIEFDHNFGGHKCNGKGKEGYCYYVPPGIVDVLPFNIDDYDPEDFYEDDEPNVGDIVLINDGYRIVDMVGKIMNIDPRNANICVQLNDIIPGGTICKNGGIPGACYYIDEQSIMKYLKEEDYIPSDRMKKMKELKIGTVLKVNNNNNIRDLIGIVVELQNGIGVQFMKNINGHNCNGKGVQGYCYYIIPDNIVEFLETSDYNDEELKKEAKRLEELKVGDYIIVDGQNDGIIFEDELGKIINIQNNNTFGTVFFKNLGGHQLNGKVKNGYGYNIYSRYIKKIIKKEYYQLSKAQLEKLKKIVVKPPKGFYE